MSRQDRQGARTPAELEQKYNFGDVFSRQEKENAQRTREMSHQQMTTREFIFFAMAAINRIENDLSKINAEIEKLKASERSSTR